MSFTDPDLVADEVAQAEAALARIADHIDGWQPSEGHIETAVAEGVGTVVASAVAAVRSEARDVMSGFGEGVLDVARVRAQPARGMATFTAIDAIPRRVPDGTELVMRTGDGEMVAFALVGDLPITSTATGEIVALEPGPLGNGLSGVPEHHDELPWLASVAVTGSTGGGTDDEDEETYRNKVVRRARRYRAIEVVPDDYAATALDVPTIARCAVVNRLDLTNPSAPDDDALGHVSLFPLDAAGAAVDGSAAAALVALLDARPRLMPVVTHVGTAERVAVDAELEVRVRSGADRAVVISDVEVAIRAAYDPAAYGFDAEAPGLWTLSREPVRHYDLAAVAAAVDGVSGVVRCLVNGGAEVRMEGWAPLPSLGALTVTAVA